MPFTTMPFFQADTAGSEETISLRAHPPAKATNATIANAFYGVDANKTPIQQTIAADGLSFSIKMLPGINALVVNLVSPDPQNELVDLCQDQLVLANPELRNHSASSTIFVQGT